jgi:FkbM family methyltransferase
MVGGGESDRDRPSPENLECLRRNLKDEIASGRLVLYPKGIWNQEAMLKLAVDPSNSANNSLVREVDKASYVEVPLTTVDLLKKELGLARVDFIKMDIEGTEKEALAGARETIRRYRPRMAVCTYHLPGDSTRIPALVRETRADYRLTRACLCALDGVSAEVAYFE